ncbi:hypothetical protein M5K25_001512 [Dendrobium thyrsiflorum]|uniref:Uncharacterized protein n=1 Tax=Dendrobium thyrsiflorum TaxID=117978 RepID=A0ABD0VRN7_DENTH
MHRKRVPEFNFNHFQKHINKQEYTTGIKQCNDCELCDKLEEYFVKRDIEIEKNKHRDREEQANDQAKQNWGITSKYPFPKEYVQRKVRNWVCTLVPAPFYCNDKVNSVLVPRTIVTEMVSYVIYVTSSNDSKMSMLGWWMVQITVLPISAIFFTARMTIAADLASTPDVGSSMNKIDGLATSSTAIVSRLRCSVDKPFMPGIPTKASLSPSSSTVSRTASTKSCELQLRNYLWNGHLGGTKAIMLLRLTQIEGSGLRMPLTSFRMLTSTSLDLIPQPLPNVNHNIQKKIAEFTDLEFVIVGILQQAAQCRGTVVEFTEFPVASSGTVEF